MNLKEFSKKAVEKVTETNNGLQNAIENMHADIVRLSKEFNKSDLIDYIKNIPDISEYSYVDPFISDGFRPKAFAYNHKIENILEKYLPSGKEIKFYEVLESATYLFEVGPKRIAMNLLPYSENTLNYLRHLPYSYRELKGNILIAEIKNKGIQQSYEHIRSITQKKIVDILSEELPF